MGRILVSYRVRTAIMAGAITDIGKAGKAVEKKTADRMTCQPLHFKLFLSYLVSAMTAATAMEAATASVESASAAEVGAAAHAAASAAHVAHAAVETVPTVGSEPRTVAVEAATAVKSAATIKPAATVEPATTVISAATEAPTVEPGSGADEDAAHEVAGAVVTVRSARIRVITVVAVAANRRGAVIARTDTDRHSPLRISMRCSQKG